MPTCSYTVAEERREIRLRLISVLRFLTVDLTFANIVVQLCANPTGSTQVFSVVWDFFIIIWFLLFTLIYKARNTLPPIHLFVGDWSFKYSGPEREHDVGDAIRAVASNKPSRLAVALQHLIDVSLAVVLLSCSIVNAIDMNIGNRLWYHNDPRLRAAVSISVLHFFVL